MNKKTNRHGLSLMLVGLLLIVAALLLVLYNNMESNEAGKASDLALQALKQNQFNEQMNNQQTAAIPTAVVTPVPTATATATPALAEEAATETPVLELVTTTPTPTPTPVAEVPVETATPVPTATPTLTPEPEAVEVTETVTAEPTATPSPTPGATADAEPESTAAASLTDAPTATPTATPAPATAAPTATSAPATATPTATPAPATATPAPQTSVPVTDAPSATKVPEESAAPEASATPEAVLTAAPYVTPEPLPIWERVPGYEMPVVEAPVSSTVTQKFVGTLNIPSLGVELPVQSTWSYEQLAYTPCRYAGNVYNDGFVIIAHRFDSHFAGIGNLPVGANVNFTDMNGNTFRFRVVAIETLDANQTEELLSDEYALSLMTCTISSTKRIVVRCERR